MAEVEWLLSGRNITQYFEDSTSGIYSLLPFDN
jgi:hypothetical protein